MLLHETPDRPWIEPPADGDLAGKRGDFLPQFATVAEVIEVRKHEHANAAPDQSLSQLVFECASAIVRMKTPAQDNAAASDHRLHPACRRASIVMGRQSAAPGKDTVCSAICLPPPRGHLSVVMVPGRSMNSLCSTEPQTLPRLFTHARPNALAGGHSSPERNAAPTLARQWEVPR